MKNIIISARLVFCLSAASANAATEAAEKPAAATAKNEAKKEDYKVVCRRVKMTGSNRSEKVCKRVSASKSDSKKRK
jgi:hypothetical protein